MAKEHSPSLVKLLGTLFASALVTALATGALAALRLQGVGYGLALVAASAAFAMPALVVCAMVRLAAASLGPQSSPQLRPAIVALTLCAGCVFVPALALGRVLRANTHHTGLAGTTFAVVCAALALGLLPFGLRVASGMRRWPLPRQSALLAAVVVGALGLLGMGLARVHHAVLVGDLGFGAAIPADLATLLFAGVVVSLAQVGRFRLASVLAPPLLVALVMVGISVTRTHPDLAAGLSERALFAARCSAWIPR